MTISLASDQSKMIPQTSGAAAGSILDRLAARYGIAEAYRNVDGEEVPTPDSTKRLLLAAMGAPAADDDQVRGSLDARDRADGERWLPSVQVVPWERSTRLEATIPGGAHARITVALESGERLVQELRGGRMHGSGSVRLGQRLPPGYHDVTVEGCPGMASGRLIVAPPRALGVLEALGVPRAWGICTNLYTVKGDPDRGAGDLGELERLAGWAGARGASFVGVNPLHALHNQGHEVSPYRPVSRIFGNPLYIDLAELPGIGDGGLSMAQPDPAADGSPAHLVAYGPLWRAKRELLRRYHAERRGATSSAPVEAEPSRERALRDHARYMAIANHTGRLSWREWPEALRDARGPGVAEFAREHAADVELETWLQHELGRQLARVRERAVAAGARLGIYQDLAVGSSPDGSDFWGFPGLFVEGASIGAPPDAFTAEGQVWGLPPVHPIALREDAYDYFVLMVRAAMSSAGMVRIDHVMGLMRQFWVPVGLSGREGAYVAYPFDDLAGILALESARHGTVVVGEDLGTVPHGFTARLDRWGILSTRVTYFEMDPGPTMRPAATYRESALVSANSHDLAPLRGWLGGDDLWLRRRIGAIASDAELDAALGDRRDEVDALVARLRADGFLSRGDLSFPGIHAALARFLGSTPCRLVALSLDDLAGEREPVNVPGVPLERHPSWSRRMASTLPSILESGDACAVVDALREAMDATAPARSSRDHDASTRGARPAPPPLATPS